jgi:hypothetical protein
MNTPPTPQPDQAAPEDPAELASPSAPIVAAYKAPKPAKKQDRTTMALLLVAVLVAVGGIGFAIGHVTAPSGTNTSVARPSGFGRGAFASLAPGQTFNPGSAGSGLRGGAGSVSGTVMSFDGATLVLQEAGGGTISIDVGPATTYHGETSATQSQVTTGSSVTVSISTGALVSAAPSALSSGAFTLTAKDILIATP